MTDDDGGRLEVGDDVDTGAERVELTTGIPTRLTRATPIELPLRAVNGYQGDPADFHSGRLCVMSERMVDVLRDAGVDNLQVFPAQLVDERTGKRWPAAVVNVVGRVAAADLAESERVNVGETAPGEAHFARLVVDPEALGGLLMVRLAESPTSLLIHEQVKQRLERASLTGVAMTEVATP